MPGYYGGAGDFTLDAREIVKRVPGLQVWAFDRRSQALEDTSRFADALAGRISPQQAFDYVRAGILGPTGDWVDGEATPIERLAQTFGQEPANATEWYFPAKLSIDVDAINALTRNAQSDYLKLRAWHRRAVDLPLYALQTDLTHGHVLRGARRFIAGSKVPRDRSVLVDASATESHLDPLTAAPERNRFLQTVVPFLRELRASPP
jgi:hypothetical protein